jgi:hypothetical protein
MSKSIICGLGGRTEIAQKVPILGECDNALALAMSAGEFDAHEQSNSADVEDLLAPRAGCPYETVRRWVLKLGPLFARELHRRRPRPTSRWHLDEVAVMIAGARQFWLWRAV